MYSINNTIVILGVFLATTLAGTQQAVLQNMHLSVLSSKRSRLNCPQLLQQNCSDQPAPAKATA